MNIKVYPAEINDKLNLTNSVSFASVIEKNVTDLSRLEKFQRTVASANPNQVDLFYRYAILASIGWNGNDDVFLKEELWKARATPVDKQLNFMHSDDYIIGHMTEAIAFDKEGNVVEESESIFDIGVGFVLYKALANEERREKVAEIISEIDEGKWFVSMECRFPDFDYAVIDSKGNHKIVQRTEASAFLTKHLRAYGGTGEYQEYKIGRVLKDLFFSGIGIVDNPANKRSIIFDTSDVKSFSSQGSIIIRESSQMEEEVKQLKAELAKANEKLADVEKTKAEVVNKQIEALNKQVAELTETAESAKKACSEKDAEMDKMKKDKEACASEIETLKKTVADLKTEQVKAGRLSALAKVGLNDAKALEVYNAWATVSDEQFNQIVVLHTPKAEATKQEVVPGKIEEAVAEVKPAPVQVTESVNAETAKASLQATFASMLTKPKK